ncbi:MAG: hypothetical protein Q7S52_03430 [bacterium]|nr:hypothetical protein [bacterium]
MYNPRHYCSAIVVVASLVLPALAFAAQAGDVFELSQTIYNFLARLGVLFWLLATMLFIWGVVKFIRNANDTTEHEAGKKFIMWGVISFVVLVSLWAIVELVLVDTFDITSGGQIGGQNPYIYDN